MRGAPPVVVESAAADPIWRAVQAAVMALSAAAAGAWVTGLWGAGGAAAALAAAVAGSLVAVLAWRTVDRSPVDLDWDGAGWRSRGVAVRPAVVADLGDWMLVRLDAPGAGRPRWIGLSRPAGAAAWHAVRCALHAAPAAPADGAGAPPSRDV